MTILLFIFALMSFAFLAGLLGALTGLGGGVVIIPVLVILFHIDIHFAMGASIISVIATSSGAAAAFMREGYTNLRIGMFLEVAAVLGAFIGALLIGIVSKTFLGIIFSLLMLFSALITLRRNEASDLPVISHSWAIKLKLNGTYPRADKIENYYVENVPAAFSLMGLAGILSGLLGIGSGTLKVLAMDQALKLPFKVATSTSNFMIGITAAVSAGVYFSKGYINPVITFPVMLGVLIGSFVGARVLTKMHNRSLRMIFSAVLVLIALQMFYKAITGTI